MRLWGPRSARRLSVFLGLVGLFFFAVWVLFLRMPGTSFAGFQSPLSDEEVGIRAELRDHVHHLAVNIGQRQDQTAGSRGSLGAAADYVFESFGESGEPRRLGYRVARDTHVNVELEIPGGDLRDEIVVIGAHYDTAIGTPGANDNASGVAATLVLARRFADRRPRRTLRFVAFANEEPLFFRTPEMGSRVYAYAAREKGDDIVAMLSLETIGYYTDSEDSQQYPLRLLALVMPSTGNFLAFAGDWNSRALVRQSIGAFRREGRLPSEGLVAFSWVTGVDWSDHRSFWQEGYPAIMVTDTAPLRYPHYHSDEDTIDKLDFDRMTRAVLGLEGVVRDLVDS